MAVTAAKAAYQQTIDSTGGVCFNPALTAQGKACGIVISCATGSANSLLVSVGGLHETTDFYEIAAGQSQVFRVGDSGLGSVFIKGNGGNATAGWALFVSA